MERNVTEHAIDKSAELLKWRDSSSRLPTFVGGGVALIGFIAFGFIDRLFPSAASILNELLLTRCMIIAILLAIVVVRWRFKTGMVGMACAPILLLTVATGASYIAGLLGGTSTGYHDAVSIAMVTYAAVVPETTPRAVLLFALCIASYFGCVQFLTGLGSSSAAVTQLAILILSAGCAAGTVWLRNRAKLREIVLTKQAQAYIRQLEQSDADKSAFYANVSHELRTPLMLVLASIENIRDEVDQAGVHTQQFATANRNGLRLLHTIDELLELSRLESASPKLSPARWSLQEFLREQVEEISPLAAKKEIALVYTGHPPPVSVFADRRNIQRVIRNLLTNALKFTPVGGRIEITSILRDLHAEISVSDTGAGIAADELPHVFKRYYQGGSGKSVGGGGVGIGLHMCERIVLLHEGTINIRSKINEGTTVTFTLPGASIDRQTDEKGEFSSPATDPKIAVKRVLPKWDKRLREQDDYQLSGLRAASERDVAPQASNDELALSLLIVDDDPELLNLVAGMVASQYNVFVASDGAQGLEVARQRLPDIIISDVNMPNMDGWEMLRALRQDPELKDVPIIMMTARGLAEDRQTASEFKADNFLPKPFTGKELRPILMSHLHRQTSHMEQVAELTDEAVALAVSGLAHDIMNPVSFVKGSSLTMARMFSAVAERAETANIDLREEKQLHEEARQVVRLGLERVTEAIGHLKSIAKGMELGEPVVVDLTPMVQRSIAVARAKADIAELFESKARVALKPGQLERVLLNLIINAIQAGGEGCSITVKTSDDEAKGVATVEVMDKGPGMDATTLAKIFEPRFTTKATGSGLGLFMAREIIKSHHGHLSVDSHPGHGTTFTITLPAVR